VLLCLPLLAHGLVVPGKTLSKGDLSPSKDDKWVPKTLDEWSDNYIDQVIVFFVFCIFTYTQTDVEKQKNVKRLF
jgi:hypothetical protein